MNNKLHKNEIQICDENICINAKGDYANIIAAVVTFSVIAIGVSALIKALR